ncbi:hypothetical protein CKW39_01050 [Kocuria sp. WRN011]|uniref:ParB N-terminal domain-containing protein n=1 Tax=Kocuria sp. WRN011 TaxID=2029858 RepID=UPI000BB06841|nr:ParB N-terminal domain-containing protein [Kocuria sp. WRN011]PBB09701.1 hypothetical protein CKW39_01050 [Kocuria sp. WRN011]
MVSYSATTLALDDIVLDPNNFRFKKPSSTAEVAEKRFAEDKVQALALARIQDDGVGELKLSISENGFVPVERIVVRAIDVPDAETQTYVAVEGNRRTAALKLLQRDNAGGVDLPATVVEVFDKVPVLIAEDASPDDLLAIMGIRHVGGPKEWGGYQAARLVYQLLHDNDLSAREVASRLGLSVQEVNRRHRAFSALAQMTEDEAFGDAVTPEMYPVFHEVVGQPSMRDWLGWDTKTYTFADSSSRELLYGWLAGTDGADPKITSFGDIRLLRQVMENEDAFLALTDDDQTLEQAVAIANADARATKWLPNVKVALKSLSEMSAETIENLGAEELRVLEKLRARARGIIRSNEVAAESDDADEDD